MEIGTVKLIDIDQEMRAAYLDYAMSVITARALPDVRDGLKPVQRRILYAMNELGLTHTAAYKKSARIVGEVLGKYHPHGDAPVYETMVRMAQDFSMRYLLVDGQGNFGSVDGDPPAAMRYTEARLTAPAEELLLDLDKNTVDFVDNFDGTLKEPSVLPARLPNLILNGASGIAVGMATNIPPHNLREVADAIVFLLDQFQRAVDNGVPFEMARARVHARPVEREAVLALRKHLSAEFKARVAASVDAKLAALDKTARSKEHRDDLEHEAILDLIDNTVDVPMERLMEFIIGPDFPTGGIIVGRKGIVDAYSTGHGRIVMRAKAFIEERGADRSTIIITELPYQVNKAALVEKIADLVRDRRIEGVAELRDESDRQGMRVVIELRRDVQARTLLNNLFKLTAMQSTFSVNLLALVDGEPRVLNLKRLLQHYIDYRHQVITRRTQFDLDKARARAHILEGLKIALDNLDEVISTIRNSPDAEVARTRLMKRFKLSELQAQAILDMQLRRLAALERKKIEEELAQVVKLIAYLEDLLAHPIKVYGLIKQDLLELKEKYGDDRRTRIREEEAEDFTAEDLIPDEDVTVVVSSRGYVKRVPADTYRAQARRSGSRAITGVVSKEQDPPAVLLSANTHDTVLFLTNLGKAYGMKCHELPAADRQARGVPLSNLISTALTEERICGMATVQDSETASITFVTRQGEIKRVAMSEMVGARASGINVVAVPTGDEVVWAGLTRPTQEIIIVTEQGQSIRFAPETEVRASGRGSGGVRAIKLDENDRVVAVDIVEPDGSLVVVTSLGWVKSSPLSEFSSQGRAGGGIRAATLTEKNGVIAGAAVLSPGDDVLIVSAQGQVVRRPADELPAQARAGRGVRIIELEKGDRPVAILRLRPEKRPTPPADETPAAEAEAQPTPKRKRTPAAETPAVAETPTKAKRTRKTAEVPAEAAAPSPDAQTKPPRRKAAAEGTEGEAAPVKKVTRAKAPAGAAAEPAAAKSRGAAKVATESKGKTPTRGGAAATAKQTAAQPEKPAKRAAAAKAAKPSGVERPSQGRTAGAKPTAAVESTPEPAAKPRRRSAQPTPTEAKAEKPAATRRTKASSAPTKKPAEPEPTPPGVRRLSTGKLPSRLPPQEPTPEPPVRRAAERPDKDAIVVRSGGKTTLLSRTPDASRKDEAEKKKGAKGGREIQLPLWGDKKKK